MTVDTASDRNLNVQQASDAGKDGEWTVRFIMPSKYTMETLPKPASDDVALKEVPASRRAAIRFSGMATDELIAKQETTLRRWLEQNGYAAKGTAVYAYYNDPFTPGFLRRTEVMLSIDGEAD